MAASKGDTAASLSPLMRLAISGRGQPAVALKSRLCILNRRVDPLGIQNRSIGPRRRLPKHGSKQSRRESAIQDHRVDRKSSLHEEALDVLHRLSLGRVRHSQSYASDLKKDGLGFGDRTQTSQKTAARHAIHT